MGTQMTHDAALFDLHCQLQSMLRAAGLPQSRMRVSDAVRTIADSFLPFQRDTLGVWVGGFIVIDPVDPPRPSPLFSKERNGTAFYLPYAWATDHGKHYRTLIDAMFLCWRKAESLVPPGPADLFPPEYVFYTAQAGGAASHHEHRSETINRNNFSCHYVTLGETLFFLAAWRLLRRFLESGAADREQFLEQVQHTLKEPQSTRPHRHRDTKWFAPTPREAQWCAYIAGTSDKELHDQWEDMCSITETDYGLIGQLIISDLQNLQLVHGATQRYLPSDARPPAANRLALARYLQFLESGPASLSDSSPDPFPRLANQPKPEALCDFISYLFDGIFRVFQAAGDPKELSVETARDCLTQLYRTCRFPIIPYFFWSVADRDIKTHLVLPIGASPTSRFNAPVYKPVLNRSLHHSFDTYEMKTLSTSVYVVIGSKPLRTLDWTLSPRETNPGDSAVLRSLANIHHYFSLFAWPVWDQAYYQRVLAEKEQYYRRLVAQLRHSLKGRASSLAALVASLRAKLPDAYQSDARRIEAGLAFFLRASAFEAPFSLDLDPTHADRLEVNGLLGQVVTHLGDARIHFVPFPQTLYTIGVRAQLEEAVLQLLENAQAFVPTEGGVIRLCVEYADDWLVVHVADNGPGIHPSIRPRLFQPFAAYPQSRYGIGLAHTAAILRAHGGSISEIGIPNEGAHFVVRLPAQKGDYDATRPGH